MHEQIEGARSDKANDDDDDDECVRLPRGRALSPSAQAAAALMEARIAELLEEDGVAVPAYPAVAMRLTRMLSDDRVSVDALAQVVQLDPAVSAAVIRSASSSVHARKAQVATAQVAIQRLGLRAVQQIVYAVCFGGAARADGPLLALRETLWRHAVVSAHVAQALAERRRVLVDDAFLCGLMHDFGKVVAVTTFERMLADDAFDGWAELSDDDWGALLERHHTDVGLVVAAHWGLPPLLAEALAGHHQPAATSPQPQLIELMQATDAVADELECRVGVTREQLERVASLRAGEPELVEQLVARLPAQIAALLNVDNVCHGGVHGIHSAAESAAARGDWCGVDVEARVHDTDVDYRVVFVHPRGLVLFGRAPLLEGHMHHIDLRGPDGELSLWGYSRFTHRHEDGFLIDVKPFASTGEATRRLELFLTRFLGPATGALQ